jgi:hypothetical protein
MAGPPSTISAAPAGDGGLLDVAVGDVPHAPGDHHRLVEARPAPVVLDLERAEEAGERGPAELVGVRRSADGRLERDLQRRRDAVGAPGARSLPRLRQRRQPEVRQRVPGEAGLGLASAPDGPLVADLAAGPGGGARVGRDRGGVVVRLDLGEQVQRRGGRELVLARAGVGQEALGGGPAADGAVVAVGGQHAPEAVPALLPGGLGGGVGLADHAEQRVGLGLPVDGERGVEDLVPAVLAVGLREHHQLGVGGIAPERVERGPQVLELGGRQREAERGVRSVELVARHAAQRLGRVAAEQRGGGVERGQHGLGHAVVDERRERSASFVGQGVVGGERPPHAPLQADHRRQAGAVGDLRRLGGPRRGGAGPRDHEQAVAGPLGAVGGGAVREQRLELFTLGGGEVPLGRHEVHEVGGDGGALVAEDRAERREQGLHPERAEGGTTTEHEHRSLRRGSGAGGGNASAGVVGAPAVRTVWLSRRTSSSPCGLHSDPADRIVAATAVHLGASLITADRLLREAPAVRALW